MLHSVITKIIRRLLRDEIGNNMNLLHNSIYNLDEIRFEWISTNKIS